MVDYIKLKQGPTDHAISLHENEEQIRTEVAKLEDLINVYRVHVERYMPIFDPAVDYAWQKRIPFCPTSEIQRFINLQTAMIATEIGIEYLFSERDSMAVSEYDRNILDADMQHKAILEKLEQYDFLKGAQYPDFRKTADLRASFDTDFREKVITSNELQELVPEIDGSIIPKFDESLLPDRRKIDINSIAVYGV